MSAIHGTGCLLALAGAASPRSLGADTSSKSEQRRSITYREQLVLADYGFDEGIDCLVKQVPEREQISLKPVVEACRTNANVFG